MGLIPGLEQYHKGGALPTCATSDDLRRPEALMSSNHQRAKVEKVTARIDAHTFDVQHVAELERRPVSAVVRNALADWAQFIQQNQSTERRA
jgi:hypothetical protein